jgi:hypothetical protein
MSALPPNNGDSPKRRLGQLHPERRPATKRKAIENGATGLLMKPIDFTLLREEIEIDTRLERTSRADPPSLVYLTVSRSTRYAPLPMKLMSTARFAP